MLSKAMQVGTQRDIVLLTLKNYFSLTKPKIVILLSLTGIIAYIIANNGVPNLNIFIAGLIVGYAAPGGAMAINSYIDRDIDRLMNRTNKRASVNPENLIDPPEKIVVFGSALVVLSLFIAFIFFNLLTVLLLLFGVIFYIIGYSMILKRYTVWNTIIGGLASPVHTHLCI